MSPYLQSIYSNLVLRLGIQLAILTFFLASTFWVAYYVKYIITVLRQDG